MPEGEMPQQPPDKTPTKYPVQQFDLAAITEKMKDLPPTFSKQAVIYASRQLSSFVFDGCKRQVLSLQQTSEEERARILLDKL
jgi:hypothetical protein